MFTFFCVLLLQAPPPRPTDGPDPREVQKILDEIKAKAAKQLREDQTAAHEFQEKAEKAFDQGRLAEAITLIKQAQKLDPESASIRRMVRHYEKMQGDSAERTANLNVARARLDEALALARSLKGSQPDQSKAFAQVVLDAVGRFPDRMDLTQQRTDAQVLLGLAPPPAVEAAPPAEAPVAPAAPLNTKELLKTRLSVNWLQMPLTDALQEISDAAGVTFIIDPQLAQLRWFENRIITYTANNASAEKLLNEVLEVALMESVPGKNGQILLTTKRQALAFAVNKAQDLPQPGPARQAVIQQMIATGKLPTVVRQPAATPRDLPSFLKSPEALQRELNELLGLRASKTDAPPRPKDDDKPLPLPPE